MTKIGDTVYTFDINRRIYKLDEKGISRGSPIYRERWRPWVITGEEKRSWIVTYPDGSFARKMSKASVKTSAEVENNIWMNDHKYPLSRKVNECNDIAVLKAIANIIGYRETM